MVVTDTTYFVIFGQISEKKYQIFETQCKNKIEMNNRLQSSSGSVLGKET